MLARKARQIASYLSQWTVDEEHAYPNTVRLMHATQPGAQMWFHARGKRIEICGGYPQNAYPEERPRITVGMTRKAIDIAADIQRRFLSDYLRVLEKSQQQERAAEARIARINAALESLAETLGSPVSHYMEHNREGVIHHYVDGRYVKLRMLRGEPIAVEIKATVDLEVAQAFCEAVR